MLYVLIVGIEITLYFYRAHICNYTIVKLHIPSEMDTLNLEYGFNRIQNNQIIEEVA